MINKRFLKRDGIVLDRQLSVLEVNKIAAIISERICSTFPEHGIIKSELFISLSRIHMYLAEFKDCSAAKYDYKNNAIYFQKDIDFDKIETPAVHECLHFIQAVRNKYGKLKRLGLYELNPIKDDGMAINEAAVQLMATCTNQQVSKESVKYYGLEFRAESPNYYPLECTLVRQMTYFTGTYPLYHSTIYSDDIFKNTFIMKSSKETYSKICKNLDSLVKLQENVHKESSYLAQIEDNHPNSKKIQKVQEKINSIKNDISVLALDTQELILKSCSYSDLELVRDNQGVRDFKNKLYKFQKYLIITEGYNFYNEFYIQMMEELDKKRDLIEKYGSLEVFKEIPENMSLIETRQEKLNLFQVAKQKLLELFKHNKQQANSKDSENN
ncbi:MAG: hypothetical protein IJ629_02950 [Clostridia bacterium]|nr:hypothetical protein [Clostridia bacterium]